MQIDILKKKSVHEQEEQQEKMYANIETKEKGFNPYVFNAGTVIAIGGKGFCILAGDTRLSEGYSIQSRNTSKIVQLTNKTFIATSGMQADFVALTKQLKIRLQVYEYRMDKQPTTEGIAQLVCYQLYMKRFFPFYTFNIVCGLNDKGDGICYGYDAIGSFDCLPYVVQGSGQSLIVPILDNQLKGYNKIEKTYPQTIDEMKDLILECFNSAAERDIYTGDQVEICVIQPGGNIKFEYYPLRKD